jgi:4-alpha-glucanotransferase
VFMLIQDVFGWSDRINTPATIGPGNWMWRLPWAIDTWAEVPDATDRAAWCRAVAARHGRVAGEALPGSIH